MTKADVDGPAHIFNQAKAEQVREIQRTLVGKTSGQEADHLMGADQVHPEQGGEGPR